MKDLRKAFQLIVFLLLTQVGHTEIVLEPIHSDSCICYTDAMDIKAITCIRAQAIKDSIINNNTRQIYNLKKVNTNNGVIIEDNVETISKLEDENQKINLHLVKAKRNVKTYGAVGLGIGIIGTLLILR